MGYIHSVSIDGTTHKIEPTLYTATTNNEASAALTATLTGFELIPGVSITLMMSYTNGAQATLSINSGTAVTIYYNGNQLPAGLLKAGFVYTLVYDGTNWQIVGDLTDNDTKIPIYYLDDEE